MESLSCIEETVCKVLSQGALPAHIGFIMDGNRRYAKKNNFSSVHQGHIEGVKSLKKTLLICKHIGIKEVSLFAFSVQNFNRSEEQVNGLMQLCMKTFDDMSEMSEMLLKNEIKVNIIGRKNMLREDVRKALQKIEDKTKDFSKIVVNLCFVYDSIHQIETTIDKIAPPITYKKFIENLDIPNFLDILVRTSNEHRLSNFMLAQVAYCQICILKESWPEVNIWSFIKIMFSFNYHQKQIQKNKNALLAKYNPVIIQSDHSLIYKQE